MRFRKEVGETLKAEAPAAKPAETAEPAAKAASEAGPQKACREEDR